jgi:hypothetical protein
MKIQINFVSSFGARNSIHLRIGGLSVGGVRPCAFNGGQDKLRFNRRALGQRATQRKLHFKALAAL